MTRYIVPKTINEQEAAFIDIWQTFNSMDNDPEKGGHALFQYTIFTATGTCITTGYIRIDGEAYTNWLGEYMYAVDYVAAELDIVFLSE